MSWNITTVRSYDPLYALGGKRIYSAPFPPFEMSISVTFDDNDAALEFERKVRKILEDVS